MIKRKTAEGGKTLEQGWVWRGIYSTFSLYGLVYMVPELLLLGPRASSSPQCSQSTPRTVAPCDVSGNERVYVCISMCGVFWRVRRRRVRRKRREIRKLFMCKRLVGISCWEQKHFGGERGQHSCCWGAVMKGRSRFACFRGGRSFSEIPRANLGRRDGSFAWG